MHKNIALIDNDHVVVAILPAWLLLKERFTFRIPLGTLLIIAGFLAITKIDTLIYKRKIRL